MLKIKPPTGHFKHFFLIILLVIPAISAGEILTIDEDFSTTARRDSLLTSAVWDTAAQNVHLPSQILFARGSLATTSAYSSARSGNHLFLADGVSGLRSVNLTDPDIPVQAHVMPCTDQAKGVALAGVHAYVAAGTAGLQVVDITDPAAMVDGGYFTNEDDLQYVSSVTRSGTTIYLAESGAGVAIFDISDPAQPAFVRHLVTGSWAMDVFATDNHLFVLDGGFKIFDLSDPHNPSEISFTSVTGTALRVTSAGGRAFVASGSSGLHIFDINDPAEPLLLSTVDNLWNSCRHATSTASGDTLFVAAGDQGLYVVEATDPANVETIGSFDTISTALHVLYAQNLIHMCASSDGLKLHELDPDGLDPLKNLAQTKNLNDSGDPVSRVKISAAVSDSVFFEVTANGGSSWHDVESGADWFTFPTPGTDIRWRLRLVPFDGGPPSGPACGSVSLSLDRLSSSATLTGVSDVPGDSGLQVRLSWVASRHDISGGDHSITEYSIYRRYDGSAEGPPAVASDPCLAYPPGQWDFVKTIPADMENQYATVVPTLADSNYSGVPWAVFFVRTRTTEQGVFFDSQPDSGFSVNNLQPSPPTGLTVDYSPPAGTQLSWNSSSEPRFAHYRIYRSTEPYTPVQPATLLAITTETEFFDETSTEYFYQLTLMTLDGQESHPSWDLTPATEVLPSLELLPNTPNPFNPLTQLNFLVSGTPHPVSLVVYDARGMKVRDLLAQPLAAGWHSVIWNGRDDSGQSCASGLYHARLRQGPVQRVQKMTLVR